MSFCKLASIQRRSQARVNSEGIKPKHTNIMSIEEQNTEKMNAGELGHYRDELIKQLSSTLEFLHKANLETNSRYDECIHITNEDIREECARNGIHI